LPLIRISATTSASARPSTKEMTDTGMVPVSPPESMGQKEVRSSSQSIGQALPPVMDGITR
jgi:hypothetical protein